MKNLNEYQNPDINAGIFAPVDAEAVRGKDRLNVDSPEGLHRINTFLSHFFRSPTMNPQNEVAQLKARFNHLRLDIEDFDNKKPLNPVENYRLTHGFVFGATPTTDLSKGFDTGADLPVYNLEIRTMKIDRGFKMEGTITQTSNFEEVAESYRREQRINTIREANEKSKAKRLLSDKDRGAKKDFTKRFK